MRSIALITGTVLGAVLLMGGGCTDTSWRDYGHDTTLFSQQPNESTLNASSVSTLQVVWDFSVPGGGALTASPSVYANTVYVGALNGHFYAIHATGSNQGLIRWQYPPTAAPSPPDPCGTTTAPLLISAGSGNPSGPGIASSAAIVDGVAGHTAVIFGAPDPNSNGGDGRLWAVDASTGQCLWKSAVIAPTSGTSKIGYSSPAIAHGRAYVGVSAKRPDAPITVGRVFAVDLATGALDPAFNFSAVGGGPPGGGVWSSSAITPSGNVVLTTGNSCIHEGGPNCNVLPSPDYTNSILKLDWHNGNVLWQVQPVAIQHDYDPDFSASPIVGQVSCGSQAIAVQKDGYVHAVDIKTGGPFANPACSYAGHSLECPRWSFPPAPNLPFQDDSHGDSNFKRQGALDHDHLYIAAGGYDLEPPPGHALQQIYNRLYSLNVCTSDADRIRGILPNLADNAGGVSVANGVIYLGTWTPFDTSPSPHHFYAIADTDVLPSTTSVCSYPSIPAGVTCFNAGFRNVPVPVIVKDLTLVGSIQAIPAVSAGRVYVATAGGHLYALGP
ncbi:MAG TPA: PQQ-binding-like beta-propeller repeat protein [Methylocella sp.]